MRRNRVARNVDFHDVLRLFLVLLLATGCRPDAKASSTPGAGEPAPAAAAASVEPTRRALFTPMPELTKALGIGEVTDINESWGRSPNGPAARHCYGAIMTFDDEARARAEFSALLGGLGLEPKTSGETISVEQPGLRIMLIADGDHHTMLACWEREAAALDGGVAELLPDEPPLSRAGEIVAAHGGLESVDLGWSAERGRTVVLVGVVAPGKAEATASWFAERGYGAVQPNGAAVYTDHPDGSTSQTNVGPSGLWVVELVDPSAASPFEPLRAQ